jgi:hypothetical protein
MARRLSVCGGQTRFSIDARKNVYFCHGDCARGGDPISLVRHVHDLDFESAVEFIVDKGRVDAAIAEIAGDCAAKWRRANRDKLNLPTRGVTEPLGRRKIDVVEDPTVSDAERRQWALATWDACVEPRCTIVQQYLERRGLTLADDLAGEVLRYHIGDNAMVALMRHIATDEPMAIHRTFFSPYNGDKIGRKFLAPVKNCAIKFDDDDAIDRELTIGEGIETVLSARVLGLAPAWALGSKGAIAKFPMIPGVSRLRILAEPDAMKEVKACAARWRAPFREVIINRSKIGKDLNDAIRALAI